MEKSHLRLSMLNIKTFLLLVLVMFSASFAHTVPIQDYYKATSISEVIRKDNQSDQSDQSNQPKTIDVTERMFKALTRLNNPEMVAQNDLSRAYLGMMFGYVPGSLSGSSELISLMFKIFNVGILSFAAILVVYSTVFGMSSSAHDGGAIGSGKYSPWAAGRVIGSMGLLLPTPSGYSAIQLVIMKVVVSGIVAANTMWHATVDFVSLTEKADLADSTQDAPKSSGVKKLLDHHGMAPLDPAEDGLSASPELTKEVGNTHYVDYTFPEGNGDRQYYLPYINRAILDTINIIQPCRKMLPEVSGTRVKTVFTTHKGSENGSRWVELRAELFPLTNTKDSTSIVGFRVLGLDEDFQGYLFRYISTVSRRLVTLQESKKKQASGDEVISIFKAATDQLYDSVKSNAPLMIVDIDPSQQSGDVKSLKNSGWVAAGIEYKTLFDIGADSASSKTTNSVFGKLIPQNAKLRNYEYVVVDSQTGYKKSPTKSVLKTSYLRLKQATSQPLTPKSQSEPDVGTAFKGVLFRPSYRMPNAYDVLFSKNIDDNTDFLFSAWSENIQSKPDTSLNSFLATGPFALLISNLKENIANKDSMKTFNMIEGIQVNHLLVAEEIQTMTNSVMDAFFGGSGAILSNWGGGDAISTLGDFGKALIKSAMNYFNKSRQRLYAEITEITEITYGISVGPSLVKGAVRALESYHQAKIVANNQNKEKKRIAKEKAASYREMNTVSSIVLDPIMSMIEFSQAAAKSIIGLYMPIGNGLAVTYFVAGMVLAAYIPFIPTIMYIFAVFAWMFAVIEAMLAAPIVVIGFANPEGHEMLGKSEQALMLLLGVFLRPMLTLIGFMLSIKLAFVAVGAFNQIFSISVLPYVKLLNANIVTTNPLPYVFTISSVIVLYAYAMVVIVEQCYSIIYVVPDQILKWIGGPLDSSGAAISAAVRSASSGLSSQAQSASQGLSSGSQGATGISTS